MYRSSTAIASHLNRVHSFMVCLTAMLYREESRLAPRPLKGYVPDVILNILECANETGIPI